MQLISIGDAILNLDEITVLDIDRTPTNISASGVVLRVHGDSSQAVIEFAIPLQTATALLNLVPQNMRFPGSDRTDV